MVLEIIAIIVIALLVLGAIFIYNRLIAARQLVQNGWSDIEVQLKRRADLIPQIVNTVKAYAAHENRLFTELTEKRNQATRAGGAPAARASAENALKAPLGRVLALAEDYPELKANQNFLDLQNELSDTETKIEMARRFYNGAVRQMNVLVQSFPVNLIAGPLGFNTQPFFDADDDDSAPVMVEFGA